MEIFNDGGIWKNTIGYLGLSIMRLRINKKNGNNLNDDDNYIIHSCCCCIHSQNFTTSNSCMSKLWGFV